METRLTSKLCMCKALRRPCSLPSIDPYAIHCRRIVSVQKYDVTEQWLPGPFSQPAINTKSLGTRLSSTLLLRRDHQKTLFLLIQRSQHLSPANLHQSYRHALRKYCAKYSRLLPTVPNCANLYYSSSVGTSTYP